ncbi:MAG: SMI1/KNR4 family protein [Bacteroidia bacterium]
MYSHFRENKYEYSFKGDLTYEKVLEYFRSQGLKLGSGVSEEYIEAVEKIIGFKFPDDYKAYHKLSNGFLECGMDSNCFSIWPFDRLIEEYNYLPNADKDFIPISDYLINSHWIGYQKNKNGIYKDYEKTNPIAENFEEFLELLLIDSDKLY